MPNQERPLRDRVWEFTKDLSVKVSKKAEKHWKINTLRVEIASIKHRINVKYKELGRYVFESQKADALDSDSFRTGSEEFFNELKDLEHEVETREQRIELLELELPPVSYADELARFRDLPDFEEEEIPPLPSIPNEALERSLAELRAKVQPQKTPPEPDFPDQTPSLASANQDDESSEASPAADQRPFPEPAHLLEGEDHPETSSAGTSITEAETDAANNQEAEAVLPPLPREDRT
jgi:hypothetical protein